MGARYLHQNVGRKIMNRTILPILAALALIIPFKVSAQDAASTPAQEAASSSSSDYVSRAEYDKLKTEHDAMKKELAALKTAVRQMANGSAPAAPAEGPNPVSTSTKVAAGTPTATDELRQDVDTLKTQVKETFPGSTKFLVAGYGTSTFEAKSGEDPFFDATFNAFL